MRLNIKSTMQFFKHSRYLCTTSIPKLLRTETNVADLSIDNLNQWFRIPNDVYKKLNFNESMPKQLRQQTDTFHECCVMVRKPYLDITNCINHSMQNPKKPVVRYVIYGRHGTGKSVTLHQLVYWAHSQDWVVVFIDAPDPWVRAWKGAIKSSFRSDRIDLPLISTKWLGTFKRMNAHLMKDLVTEGTYNWGPKEVTKAGEPLLNVVDHGLDRVAAASDCFAVLLKELKQSASKKRIKLLVAVDLVNTVFEPYSKLYIDSDVYAKTDEITILRAVKKLLKYDWNNGAIVTAVDCRERDEHHEDGPRGAHLPYRLLGREGFDWMDPFLPVEIPDYSNEEAQSVLDYYMERNWLTTPQGRSAEGHRQLKLISNKNPLLLERLCSAL